MNKSIAPFFGLLFIVGLSVWILHPFFSTLLWAFIIAYVLFPLHSYIEKYIANKNISAGLLTGVITVILLTLAFSLLTMIEHEMTAFYQTMMEDFVQASWQLPSTIKHIPYLGDYLQTSINKLLNSRTTLMTQIISWLKAEIGQLAQFLGSIGQRLIKLCFVLVTLFFCFRDGKIWIQQLKQLLQHYLGESYLVYFQTAGNTTRAVVYGLFLAALGQGFIAGIGYFFAGVKTPLLLMGLTALLALIPMGAMLVWIPTALLLIVNEQFWAGLGLLIWGILVVSTVDNIIRPFVICNESNIPFLVILFGVFGGLSQWGMLGLFLGPVILSLLLESWKNIIKRI